uniref:Pkinase_Tyr domain-containing protein n=1 Tax=Heterorhabditis bacteriophora TaxID=37862 RepID=A0A1I7WDV9_HETBA
MAKRISQSSMNTMSHQKLHIRHCILYEIQQGENDGDASQTQEELAELLRVDKLGKQRRRNFLWKIINGDDKWIMYGNPKRTHSWMDSSQPLTSMPKAKKSFCWNKKTIYQHDNSRPHAAPCTQQTILNLDWEVLPHLLLCLLSILCLLFSYKIIIETKTITSIVKMRDFLRMRQLATIDQTYVVMEKFVLKERIVFDKHDLNLLFQVMSVQYVPDLLIHITRLTSFFCYGFASSVIQLHYYSPEMRAQLKSLMYTNRADTITLSNASGQASDMWSFGTILYEMVFRRKHVDVEDVYEGEEENVIMCEKAEAQLIREPVVPEDGDVHADILNLIQKCWKKENQRPDAVLARKITDSTLKM